MSKLILLLGLMVLSGLGSAYDDPSQENNMYDSLLYTLSSSSNPTLGGSTDDNKPDNDIESYNGVELIPRKALFGNPDKTRVLLTSDGKWIAYKAPLNGVLNVWVGPADNISAARPITNDTFRGIQYFTITYTNRHIIYNQDTNGDENWKFYCVDLETGERKALTPLEGVNAVVLPLSYKYPYEIPIGLNDRDPEFHDLYLINLTTGERRLLERNDEFSYFVIDSEYRVRLGSKTTPDGGEELYRHTTNGSWELFMTIDPEDDLNTGPLRGYAFDKTGEILYMYDSRGRDTAALTSINFTSGEETVLTEDSRADITGTMAHPVERTPDAAYTNYERMQWKVLNSSVESDMEYLSSVSDGELIPYCRTLDDRRWLVRYHIDNGPVKYYLYDRDLKQTKFLFEDREDLKNYTLGRMHPVVIRSRDGLDLVSYYTLPEGVDEDGDALPEHPLSMVLLVHGGPWSRDSWGFDPVHQLLANRGYAVLSVNFRGSTGFGKSFTNAGDREWGGKMHDDLIDAVNWAIDKGIADPERVAIMGGSYGGYATLAGMTFTPTVFACGVDICGISNLTSFLLSVPPYWQTDIEKEFKRVGDYRTEDGKDFLRERSPLTYVDRIQRPLLIGQGANDPRVKQNESEQIVTAMQAKNIPVTYVLYPDEGHGFVRPENRLSFYAVAEAFLARHLQGRYESVGEDFQGANITVPVGIEGVSGLAEALQNR